jgi:predicted TIM-barrel fold metal-dependent hydrolase
MFEVVGSTPEERVTELVKFGDRVGIERFVLFMGFPFYTDPTPDQLQQQNNQVPSAPELDPIVERAASLNAPILQHTWFKATGNLPGESTPLDLAELARRHPNIPLICSHVGGDWERGIRGAIRATRNVYIDVAGFDPTAGAVEMAVRELGSERILFGSDAGVRTFASQLGKVMGAEIPEAARKQILGGNLKRLLAPILKAKGHRL